MDDEFPSGDSGAAKSRPIQCSALRKGDHVLINKRPCKIASMSTSKTGKHGHAKVHLVAIDIFTGKKLEDICPSTHNMQMPDVLRKEYSVMLMDEDDDNLLTLQEQDGALSDLSIRPPADIAKKIAEHIEKDEPVQVVVLKSGEEEMVLSCKKQQI